MSLLLKEEYSQHHSRWDSRAPTQLLPLSSFLEVLVFLPPLSLQNGWGEERPQQVEVSVSLLAQLGSTNPFCTGDMCASPTMPMAKVSKTLNTLFATWFSQGSCNTKCGLQ